MSAAVPKRISNKVEIIARKTVNGLLTGLLITVSYDFLFFGNPNLKPPIKNMLVGLISHWSEYAWLYVSLC